jgi:Uma2 family endonuclease
MATVIQPTGSSSLQAPSLPVQEYAFLPGVSYATYDSLISEIGDSRNLRITYHHGEMEIISPSQDHELTKKLIAQLVEALTEELNIPRMSCGSTTFKSQLLDCGLEPDECYYIQNEAAGRGRVVQLGIDPPPDLVIEVDVSRRVIKRLPIYARLGFPEIWQYLNGEIRIHNLTDGKYVAAPRSTALPMVPIKKLTDHLDRCHETDETTWIRAFRQWVRDGMK